jgi:predicted Zn-dependent peptidase
MKSIKVILVLSLIVVFTKAANASEYVPPSLYDVEYITLENGLDVVLKHRNHSHNLALRLVVNVGHRHFDCEKRETAHLLEHLIMHWESDNIEKQSIKVSAHTDQVETVYKTYVFDRNVHAAIEMLFVMILTPDINYETIEMDRKSIHLELGGRSSWLRRWLYKHRIGKHAGDKAFGLLLPGTVHSCPGLSTPDGITLADLSEAYKTYYVPNNMSLVVVGNFDRDKLLSRVKDIFGWLPVGNGHRRTLVTPPYAGGAVEVTGTLEPFLESKGRIGIVYRTVDAASPDSYVLQVLSKYLDHKLSGKLISTGLSYTVEVKTVSYKDVGIFGVEVDAELNNMESVKDLIDKELEKLRGESPSKQDIESAKQELLLTRARDYESNVDLANYYVSHLHELKANGRLMNHELAIQSVTPEDIQRVMNKYLTKDRQVVALSKPTLTYTQFFTGLGILIALTLGVGPYIYWGRRRRHIIKEK